MMNWIHKRDRPKAQAKKDEPVPGTDTSVIAAFLLAA
jgi:hypothetical protein